MDAPQRSARIAVLAAIFAIGVLAAVPMFLAPQSRAAAARPELKAGISDQKHEAFGDTRLRALGLGYARRSVPWDALRSRYQRREIDAWMQATRAAGMEPLVTFARSRSSRRGHKPPAPGKLGVQFRRFRKRYPDATT